MKKYMKLQAYFCECPEDNIDLSFHDIEKILGCKLPDSAYKYPAIWSNSDSHSLSKAWMNAGYRSENLNIAEGRISFRKNDAISSSSVNRMMTMNSGYFPIMTKETAIQNIRDYFQETIKDSHGRYLSWCHCYSAFKTHRADKDRKTIDFLALHLAFYLASWGMYRGSSFLLQKDYKIHIPVVHVILESRYDSLLGISAQDLCIDANLNLLSDISKRIRNCYAEEQPSCKGGTNNATDTLITKILLGTLGCVPAYDRYYMRSVKANKVSSGLYNKASVRSAAEFYCRYLDAFEDLRKEISTNNVEYPPMKLIDMCFWQDGFISANKNADK